MYVSISDHIRHSLNCLNDAIKTGQDKMYHTMTHKSSVKDEASFFLNQDVVLLVSIEEAMIRCFTDGENWICSLRCRHHNVDNRSDSVNYRYNSKEYCMTDSKNN